MRIICYPFVMKSAVEPCQIPRTSMVKKDTTCFGLETDSRMRLPCMGIKLVQVPRFKVYFVRGRLALW